MNTCYKCASTSVVLDGPRWTCSEHIGACYCGNHLDVGSLINVSAVNPTKETIKLEAMYYHQRQKRHRKFLANNQLYSFWRTINTFKSGKVIDENGKTVAPTIEE